MNRHLPGPFAMACTAGLLLLSLPSTSTAADINCSRYRGEIERKYVNGNLVIDKDCEIERSAVNGNLKFAGPFVAVIEDSRINGNIECGGVGEVRVENSVINGNFVDCEPGREESDDDDGGPGEDDGGSPGEDDGGSPGEDDGGSPSDDDDGKSDDDDDGKSDDDDGEFDDDDGEFDDDDGKEDDDDGRGPWDDDRFVFNASLDGYQATPLTLSTSGEGEFEAKVNKKTGKLEYELRYDDLEGGPVLFVHIHLGRPAIAGGIIAFLCSNTPPPMGVETPECPAEGEKLRGELDEMDVIGPEAQGIAPGEAEEALRALLNAAAYVNVHTEGRPSGEIRGQIKPELKKH